MSQLHVLSVNDFADVRGGIDQIVLEGLKSLLARGHRVTLFSGAGQPEPGLISHPRFRSVGLGGCDILSDKNRLRAAVQGFWNSNASGILDSTLAASRGDRLIVHVQGWTKVLSASVIAKVIERKIPLVVSLHDYFVACPNGTFFDFGEGQVCRRNPMGLGCLKTHCDRRNYGHKLWRVVRHSIQMGFGGMPSRVKHFIVTSRFSEKIYVPFLPAESKRYMVRNPIDVVRETRVDVARKRNLVFVGRLCREKAPEDFAEASKNLSFDALLVGDGELREAVLRRNPRAQIKGWVGRDAVHQNLRTARAFVFPSIWYEAQPLAPLEAMALGVPLIVSDASAASDYVKDGVNGFVYPAGNIEALERTLKKLEDDPLVDAMGLKAYEEYWSNPPTVEHHGEALESVYRAVLSESG